MMEISISTPMPDNGNCQVIEPLEARPLRARRGWSAEAKARLVERTLDPGANVSAIARSAGMAPSQLFGWRRQARVARAMTRNEAIDADRPMRFERFAAVKHGAAAAGGGGRHRRGFSLPTTEKGAGT